MALNRMMARNGTIQIKEIVFDLLIINFCSYKITTTIANRVSHLYPPWNSQAKVNIDVCLFSTFFDIIYKLVFSGVFHTCHGLGWR
jgi:hypothetical protein